MQRKPQGKPQDDLVKAPTDPELAILEALAELRGPASERPAIEQTGSRPATDRAWIGAQEHARVQALLRVGGAAPIAPERRKTPRPLHPAIKR